MRISNNTETIKKIQYRFIIISLTLQILLLLFPENMLRIIKKYQNTITFDKRFTHNLIFSFSILLILDFWLSVI